MNTDIMPFESSSVEMKSVADSNLKYNKRPAIYKQASSNRLIGRIDTRKRKTLTTQVQNSKSKLETIRETSNFESRVSMAEMDTTNNLAHQSQNPAYSNRKSVTLNKDLVSYERAMKKHVFYWSIIIIQVLYVLNLAYIVTSRYLLESSFISSHQKTSGISIFYENLSDQRLNFNKGYFSLLRAIAFNDGTLTEARFQALSTKFENSTNFRKSAEYQEMASYSRYLKAKQTSYYKMIINTTKKLESSLDQDQQGKNTLLNDELILYEPSYQDQFLSQKVDLYRAVLGSLMYSPLYDVLQKDIVFYDRSFNKSKDYGIVIYNFLAGFTNSIEDAYSKTQASLDTSISEFYSSSLILTFILLGFGFISLLVTWVAVYFDIKFLQKVVATVFSCSLEELEFRKHILTRLAMVFQNHRNDNFFYIGHLNERDLEAGNEDYPENTRTTLVRNKSFDWFGSIFSMTLVTLFYLAVMSISLTTGLRYSSNTRLLLRFSSKLNSLVDARTYQTNHLLLLTSHTLFQGTLETKIGQAYDFGSVNSKINLKQNSIISDAVEFTGKNNVDGSVLDAFFSKELFGNMCQNLYSLYHPSQEVCSALDSGVAAKGYVQIVLRFSDFLQEMNKFLLAASLQNQSGADFLATQDFIEFEYIQENYYLPIYDMLIKKTFSSLRSYIQTDLETSNQVWVNLLISVASISPLLFLYSLLHLSNRFARILFIYKLVPAWAIINSLSLRITFLETFRLNRHYFSS